MADDDTDEPREYPDKKPRVRPISRITAAPLSRLRSAKCFVEIDRRLRLGWSAANLAHAVQEEFNELTDLSFRYVKKLIERYRSSIPPTELSMISTNSQISKYANKKLANGIDELVELERLYSLQMARIDIDVDNEKKINKLLPSTGHEVFVAMKLLKQSADLKMDLGLTKRQIGSVEVTGQIAAGISERYGKDGNVIGKVITDPNSARKIISLAERLMALTEKTGIDAAQIIDAESMDVLTEVPVTLPKEDK